MEGRSFLGVGIGLAIGAGLGVATDNVALGLGLGVAIGAGLGVALDQAGRARSKNDATKAPPEDEPRP